MTVVAMMLLFAARAHAGTVVTVDGKSLEGEVSLGEGGVSVRTNGGVVNVAVEKVKRAVIVPRAEGKVVTASRGLPAGWKIADIGSVKYPGSAAVDEKGVFKMTASGWGAWGPRDSFQFAWRELEGDGQIIAHVAKLGEETGPTTAGIMIRESAAPDAPMAVAVLRPRGDVRLGRRPLAYNPDFRNPEALAPQAWLRLTRRGNLFRAYRSVDGREWTLVDSAKVEMAKKVLVGVACWTGGNSWTGSAVVESVKVISGTPGATFYENGSRLMEGVVMRDGNVRAGTIVSADGTSVKYQGGGETIAVPVEKVAQVVFNPAPAELAVFNGKTGIATTSGDFIEGEITDISLQTTHWPNKAVKVSVQSVLFGKRTMEGAKEVIAAVYGDVSPAGGVAIVTADGSVYRVGKVEIAGGEVTGDGEKIEGVVEIRR